MIPDIILYYFPFVKYLWISEIVIVSGGLKSTEKRFTITFHPVFVQINCKIF